MSGTSAGAKKAANTKEARRIRTAAFGSRQIQAEMPKGSVPAIECPHCGDYVHPVRHICPNQPKETE